ncbi:hypothetical protein M378DRAFT_369970 [Amanita muscaria Koide BX008]|uniref:Uncharacterized protein n=1 Tax=Amanita muscaria (strain Koide BX008) TaxID=946122 RepID=A0A0C2STC4_AMAMK|nr:hypothetical protein M378DRAFT_369970 [Amanita muscaria Koide BX008]
MPTLIPPTMSQLCTISGFILLLPSVLPLSCERTFQSYYFLFLQPSWLLNPLATLVAIPQARHLLADTRCICQPSRKCISTTQPRRPFCSEEMVQSRMVTRVDGSAVGWTLYSVVQTK